MDRYFINFKPTNKVLDMAVQIKKPALKKKAGKKKVISKVTDKASGSVQTKGKAAKLVSDFITKKVALTDKLNALKGEVKEVADLEKALLAMVDENTEAAEAITLKGANGETLEVSAKGKKTTVTDKDTAVDLLEAVQEGLALEIAGFTLTNLKAYLTPAQFESITETSHVNKRSIKIL
jgi:hypothetical protein